MQMCKSHWWLMKESVHAAGLWPLTEAGSYNPIEEARSIINRRAIEMGGTYLTKDNYCPLCEVDKYLGMGNDLEWVKRCMDAVIQYCKEARIVPQNARERITEVRYEVERLPSSEQQTKVAVLLGELAVFIEQDEAVRFALHNKKE